MNTRALGVAWDTDIDMGAAYDAWHFLATIAATIFVAHGPCYALTEQVGLEKSEAASEGWNAICFCFCFGFCLI